MIPIVMITDKNYFINTITCIQSIAEYSTRRKVEIYLITVDISQEMEDLLRNIKYDNVVLKFISADAKVFGVSQKVGQYVTTSALLKFKIPYLISEYDKVLYIDGDIIVRKDITELLAIDISDNYVGAIQDMDCVLNRQDNIRLNKEKYFNSGVMILNCKRLRDEHLPEKMIEMKRQRSDLHYMDQDVFNVCFDGQVCYIPLKYNYTVGYDFYSIETINTFFETNYRNEKELSEDIAILHLSGKCKPWSSIDDTHREEWMRYYNVSPVSNLELKVVRKEEKKGLLTKTYISNKITDLSIGKINVLRKERYRGYSKFYLFGTSVAVKIKGK